MRTVGAGFPAINRATIAPNLRRRGYLVEETAGSAPDGGVDLELYSGGRKTVVQCKRWRTNQVGVSLIRELFGVMMAEKGHRGIFVTSGTYAPDAIAFAHGKPLELVDGDALAELVAGVQAAQPPQEVARATPTCPKCGSEMVPRVAKRGANAGNAFWGCPRYRAVTGRETPFSVHCSGCPKRSPWGDESDSAPKRRTHYIVVQKQLGASYDGATNAWATFEVLSTEYQVLSTQY